ncbi:hypothetical protein FRB96_004641, partial [Tulasnella sp. 330]
NHDNPHQSPWNEEKGKAPAVEHLGRPGRPAYHQQASYIEEPPSTTDSRRSSSSGEIHPTTEVTKAIPVPTISPLPTSSTIRPASPPVRSTSPTLPHAISFSLPAASPCRHSQILSASSGASGSSKPGSSTTSIPMQPMHSRDDGTMDNQPQQYPQYLSAASSSESSSPSYDISQPRRTTPNGRSSSRNAMSIWDVLLLPVTVPLAIPRFFADISFRAFVFGLACGVTLVRVGTAALTAVVLGRRDVRRPRWR